MLLLLLLLRCSRLLIILMIIGEIVLVSAVRSIRVRAVVLSILRVVGGGRSTGRRGTRG